MGPGETLSGLGVVAGDRLESFPVLLIALILYAEIFAYR